MSAAVLALAFGMAGGGKVLAQAAAPSQAAPSSPSLGKTLQRIQSSGVVVIGHRESSMPMSYVAHGTPMGYSVDVCLQVAQALGRHLKLRETKVAYRLVTSSSRFDAIEKGEVDLECGSTTNTAARRERVAFTIAHFIASSRIVVQSDKPYSRIEDLDGKTLASTAGTTNIDSLAREAATKSVRVRIEPAKDHAEGFGWVVSGKVEIYQGEVQMTHPDHVVPLAEREGILRVEPLYGLTAGLTQRPVQKAIAAADSVRPRLRAAIIESA